MARIPRLQNRVYVDEETAKQAQSGILDIAQDTATGFAFNEGYKDSPSDYDRNYNNSVPSITFMDYYDEIADYLVSRYDLRKRIIVDIGCGKGVFLTRLANRYNYIAGKGIDPAYNGPLTTCEGRVNFITEYFNQKHNTT